MAHYIDADAAGGGDGSQGSPYNSWSQFLSADARDLTASGGEGVVEVFVKGELFNTGNLAGGARHTTASFTQDASNYLQLRLWPGEAKFSSKIIGSHTTSGLAIWEPGDFTRVDGVGLRAEGTGVNFATSLDQDCWLENLVCVSTGATLRPNINCKFNNVLAVSDEGEALIAVGGSASGMEFNFLTLIRGGTQTVPAFSPRTTDCTVRNVVCYGGWNTEYDLSAATEAANNAGEIAAASQPAVITSGGYVELSGDPFVDSANDDYHPAASGQLDGAGVAVTGITTDAEGTTRPDPPSIGYLDVSGGVATDPEITDVDTDETVTSDQTGVAVTGTDMGADETERTFSIVQGAVQVDQTETGTGSDTSATLSIVFDTAGDDLKHGAADLWITRDDAAFDAIGITIEPQSGHLYVDIVTPDSEADNRITAVPDIESGDQIEARGEGGGAVPTGLSLNDDATFEFSAGNDPADFDVRVWDVNDATWGAWATQSVAGELAVAGALHGQTADSPTLSQSPVLDVDSATHGQAAESPDLSQANVLDPADAAHAQTAQSPTLTQEHQLEVADAGHAQSADSPTITQAHLLVVQDARHDQAADNIIVTASSVLSTNDASHSQTAETATLSQAHQLTIADALHSQAADSVELSISVLLQVASALHAHGVDNVVLTQAHIVAIAAALHAQAAANIILQQGNVLPVDDSIHAQSADSPVLTAGEILSVASAIHAHTADEIVLTQAHVLVVSDALHQQLADMVSLQTPGLNAPTRSVFVVESRNRTFVVV